MSRIYALRNVDFAESLRHDGFTRTYIRNSTWRYYYVLTKVLFKSVIYRNGSGDYVKINIQRLDKVLGNSKIKGKRRRFSTQVIEDLVKWKVLKKQFTTSEVAPPVANSQLYQTTVYLKVRREMLDLGWHQAPVQVPEGLIQRRTAQDRAPLQGVYLNIQRYQPDITINMEAAQAFANWALKTRFQLRAKRHRRHFPKNDRVVNQQVHSIWNMALESFEDGDYTVHPPSPKTGRHATAITSLPRELRPFLRINGKPLVELDIKNSQILIFAHLLRQRYKDHLPADVQEFTTLAEEGTFYDTVAAIITETGEQVTPGLFKVDFFARVFFSKETVNYRWRRIFAQRFPSVSAAVTDMKFGDYKKLSHRLMWEESDLIVRTIAARLYREGCTEFTTLHDAFYCPADQVDQIYSTIVEEYQKLGLRVPIRVSPLVEPTEYQYANEIALPVR